MSESSFCTRESRVGVGGHITKLPSQLSKVGHYHTASETPFGVTLTGQ